MEKATEDLPLGMVKGMPDLYDGSTNVKKTDGPPSKRMQPLDPRAHPLLCVHIAGDQADSDSSVSTRGGNMIATPRQHNQ